jgi:hypothetical protein
MTPGRSVEDGTMSAAVARLVRGEASALELPESI